MKPLFHDYPADSMEGVVRDIFASLNRDGLYALSRSPNPRVREMVVKYPKTPMAIIWEALSDDNENVVYAAVDRLVDAKQDFSHMIHDERPLVRLALLLKGVAKAEDYINDPDPRVLSRAIRTLDLTKDQLNTFGHHASPLVRMAVARFVTDPTVLDAMVNDPEIVGCIDLVVNKNLNESQLCTLARNTTEEGCLQMLYRRDLPRSVYEIMANDPVDRIRALARTALRNMA